ncbi:unnamed protein product [Arctogadus glacialis]
MVAGRCMCAEVCETARVVIYAFAGIFVSPVQPKSPRWSRRHRDLRACLERGGSAALRYDVRQVIMWARIVEVQSVAPRSQSLLLSVVCSVARLTTLEWE